MPGVNVPGPCVLTKIGCVEGKELGSGSRVATPQAAGLAEYLWNLNPTLTNISMQFALGLAFVNESLPGFVDAYAAVLSLDPNVLDARVREAILDLDQNGKFDELDLAFYLQIFESGSSDMRFDLNSDGTVGGSGTAWFDLSVDGLNTAYTDVTQDIGCEDKMFNEKAATDRDVLVYYAYSDLYAGDVAAREENLGSCDSTDVVVNITFRRSSTGARAGVDNDTTRTEVGYEPWSGSVAASGLGSATAEQTSRVVLVAGTTELTVVDADLTSSASCADEGGGTSHSTIEVGFEVTGGDVVAGIVGSLSGFSVIELNFYDVESGGGVLPKIDATEILPPGSYSVYISADAGANCTDGSPGNASSSADIRVIFSPAP